MIVQIENNILVDFLVRNLYGQKSFECSKLKDVNFSDDHSQVNIVTCSQNLILKEFKLHSWNLNPLIYTADSEQF